jgi:hypothetical protein
MFSTGRQLTGSAECSVSGIQASRSVLAFKRRMSQKIVSFWEKSSLQPLDIAPRGATLFLALASTEPMKCSVLEGFVFFDHLGPWFETTKDVLFGIEFLLVQVYLIYHLVRALFFRG